MIRRWRAHLGPWEWAFLATSAVVAVVLLYLGRSATFWQDDWVILAAPERAGWTLDALMLPHNDHWLLTQIASWKVLQSILGMGSYLPYLVLNQACHVALALAVYGLTRQQAGSFIAFVAGSLFLLLGVGGEVFFFAAAVNHIAAAALGCWALLVTLSGASDQARGRWRAVVVAVLLLLAIMSGGAGLYFAVAVGAVLLLTPGRRRELWVLLPAALAFIAWELAYGRGPTMTDTITDMDTLRALGDYVRTGAAHAVGAVTGLEDPVGLILLVALVGATAWNLLGHGPIRIGAVAGVAGLLAAYAITGIARGTLGAEQAAASRYVYAVAPLILLALTAWLAPLAPLDPRRLRVALTVAVFVAVALAANLVQLRYWYGYFSDRALETRAAAMVMLEYGGTPGLPADEEVASAEDLQVRHMPSPAHLRSLFERYGSLLDDPLSSLGDPSPAMLERALLRLVEPRFLVRPVAAMPEGAGTPDVIAKTGLTLIDDGACRRIVPSGSNPSLSTLVGGGETIHLLAEDGGTVVAELSRGQDALMSIRAATQVAPGGIAAITVPDLADGTGWELRLEVPADGLSLLCGVSEVASARG